MFIPTWLEAHIVTNVPVLGQAISLFSCPGRMIANSIPARLVATRMRVALPRARA